MEGEVVWDTDVAKASAGTLYQEPGALSPCLCVAHVHLPESDMPGGQRRPEMFVSVITETGHISDGQCGQEGGMLYDPLTFVKVQLRGVSV